MFLSKHLMKAKVTSSLLNMNSVRSVAFVKGEISKLKEKGKGEEDIYFSQQERETIKRLLKKMEAQAEKAKAEDNNETGASDSDKKHQDGLKNIFEKHGIKDDKGLLKELNDWKKSK